MVHIDKVGSKFNLVVHVLLYALFFFLIFKFLTPQAEAKTVVFGSGMELVRIKHGGPTIFRFPKAVQTITGASRFEIKPANAADPGYTVLAVTPRFTNGVNEVAFFLVDGSVVRAKLTVSPNDPAADSIYDFKSQDALYKGESQNAPALTGYKVSHVSDFLPEKQSVSVELIRIYKGSPFNGYVFRLTNLSWKKNVDVDVRHVTVGDPNLAILSQSDEVVLYPKGKGVHETLLRIVAKNTASSHDVIFAIEAEDPKNSKKGD
jgi:hypothetical protein